MDSTPMEIVFRDTSSGRIKGTKRRTIYNDDYFSFERIPYAMPPTGELRFKAPQPVKPWTGIRDCTLNPVKPCQKHLIHQKFEGSENCLFVNIYAKKLSSGKPLPVMVWIFGGGFLNGGATREMYGPDYFMKEDIILVEISYRIGILGFLSLEDPELDCPGNAGLKDQLMALQWVKQNIEHFNGNPNNITLFGGSAGAGSTNFLMLTEKSKGLFHKAILMSGAIYCEWAYAPQYDWAYRVAVKCGYKGPKTEKEIFNFLKTVEAEKLCTYQNKILNDEEKQKYLLVVFAPVMEPYETEHSIFTKSVHELSKTTWTNDIPVIAGWTSFEGLYYYKPALNDKKIPDLVNILPREIKPLHSREELEEMASQIRKLYFNGEEPTLRKHFMQYLDLCSYKGSLHGIHRFLLARLTYASHKPTYFYRFDFDSEFFNHFRKFCCGPEIRGGACHGDDLSYFFHNSNAEVLPKTSPEYQVICTVIGMWVAFAYTNDPNTEQIEPAFWPPLRKTDDHTWKCLNITQKVKLIEAPESAKLALWDSFYEKFPLI